MSHTQKVLLASPFDATFTRPLQKAFKKLNFSVTIFDYRNVTGNFRLELLYIYFFLVAFFLTFLSSFKISRIAILNKMLILVCGFIRPDYLFVIKGETLSHETIEEIKKFGTKTMLWQVDPLLHPFIWRLAMTQGRAYDIYITCEPGQEMQKLKKAGFKKILYMLGAADSFQMKNLQSTSKKYDMCLIGTYHPERERFLKVLKDFDLHIWGWGAWEKSSVHKSFEGKALSQSEMLRVYSQSKIIVNIGRATGSSIPTNLRPFEAAQVGGFILAEHKQNLKEVFTLGKEIDTFKTPAELKRKVKYYLLHDKKRNKISLAMFQRVQKDHTYEVRLKDLFKQIKKIG